MRVVYGVLGVLALAAGLTYRGSGVRWAFAAGFLLSAAHVLWVLVRGWFEEWEGCVHCLRCRQALTSPEVLLLGPDGVFRTIAEGHPCDEVYCRTCAG